MVAHGVALRVHEAVEDEVAEARLAAGLDQPQAQGDLDLAHARRDVVDALDALHRAAPVRRLHEVADDDLGRARGAHRRQRGLPVNERARSRAPARERAQHSQARDAGRPGDQDHAPAFA